MWASTRGLANLVGRCVNLRRLYQDDSPKWPLVLTLFHDLSCIATSSCLMNPTDGYFIGMINADGGVTLEAAGAPETLANAADQPDAGIDQKPKRKRSKGRKSMKREKSMSGGSP